MFMTGMNFCMPNNHRNKNKEKNENNDFDTNMESIENNDNLENREKNTINYDYLSFKDLLKHIEENKKKIIDNQNDIENMIITAKDTHNEIWKCSHWKK